MNFTKWVLFPNKKYSQAQLFKSAWASAHQLYSTYLSYTTAYNCLYFYAAFHVKILEDNIVTAAPHSVKRGNFILYRATSLRYLRFFTASAFFISPSCFRENIYHPWSVYQSFVGTTLPRIVDTGSLRQFANSPISRRRNITPFTFIVE